MGRDLFPAIDITRKFLIEPSRAVYGRRKCRRYGKTTRSGYVPASFWFQDVSPGEMVYEESMYNPEFDAVLTLLTSEPGEESNMRS